MKVKVAVGYINGNWCVFGWSNYHPDSNKRIARDYLTWASECEIKEIEIDIPFGEQEKQRPPG